MTATWECGRCSTTNAPDAGFCVVCGATRTDAAPNDPAASPGPGGSDDQPMVPVATHASAPTDRNPSDRHPGFGVVGRSEPTSATTVLPPVGEATAGTSDGGSDSSLTTVLIVLLAVLLAIAVGIGAFLLTRNSRAGGATDSRTAIEEQRSAREGPDDGRHDAVSTVPVEDETTTTRATTTTERPDDSGEVARTVGVLSVPTKVRDSPNLHAGELAVIDDAGARIDILRRGPSTSGVDDGTGADWDDWDGWYQVDFRGTKGYIYAGLLEQTHGDWCTARNRGWSEPYGSTWILFRDDRGDAGTYAALTPAGSWGALDLRDAEQVEC